MKEFKVVVTGDKGIYSDNLVYDRLDRLLINKLGDENISITLVIGDNRSLDKIVTNYADDRSINVEVVKVDWKRRGSKAGYFRSDNITNICNALVLFRFETNKDINKGHKILLDLSKRKHLLVRKVIIKKNVKDSI